MDRFAIAQAFAQLESDFNLGGILWERPSNQRRNESIGCQLARIGYSSPYGWTDITGEPDDDCFDEEVRDIYMRHAIEWGLPLDDDLKAVARRIYVPEWLAQFKEFQK